MTKQSKRRLIPLIVLLAAGGVLAAVVFSPSRTDPETAVAPPTETPPAAVVEKAQKPDSDIDDAVSSTSAVAPEPTPEVPQMLP